MMALPAALNLHENCVRFLLRVSVTHLQDVLKSLQNTYSIDKQL